MKYFTYPELDFVKDVCSYWKSGNSFSHLTVTKKRQIVVTDEANSQLRVFDLNGKPLFVIPLKFSLPAYSSVHSLPDNTLLVTQCCDAGLVTRLHIMDDKAEVMWCCGGLENPTGACSNDSGLILIGSETRKAIFMISPAGNLALLTHSVFQYMYLVQSEHLVIMEGKTHLISVCNYPPILSS